MIINGEFHQPALLAPAIEALKQQGFGGDQIAIYSGKPVELAPGVLDRPSRMSLVAVLAGIAGGSLMTAFMFYTQLDYPLVTGGMPLNSGWATGVVTYELTMAGAILGTLLMFLWESGLLRGLGGRSAPKVTGNGAVVQVQCSEAAAGRAVDSLRQSGAANVETSEEGE